MIHSFGDLIANVYEDLPEHASKNTASPIMGLRVQLSVKRFFCNGVSDAVSIVLSSNAVLTQSRRQLFHSRAQSSSRRMYSSLCKSKTHTWPSVKSDSIQLTLARQYLLSVMLLSASEFDLIGEQNVNLTHVLEKGVLAQMKLQLFHLDEQLIDLLTEFPWLGGQTWLLLHFDDLLQNLAQLGPDALQALHLFKDHLYVLLVGEARNFERCCEVHRPDRFASWSGVMTLRAQKSTRLLIRIPQLRLSLPAIIKYFCKLFELEEQQITF